MEPTLKVFYGSSTRMWVAKLSLRVLSALLCIIAIGIGASLATTDRGIDDYYDSYYYYDYGWIPITMIGAQTGLAIIWDIAEGICLFARRGHRGIHPGACVGVDLILWMGMLIGAVCVGVICWGDACYYDGDSDTTRMLGLRNAVLAFMAMLTVVHFALFVIACRETTVRNKAVKIILDPKSSGNQTDGNAQQLYHGYLAQVKGQEQPPMGAYMAAPPHAYNPAPHMAPAPGAAMPMQHQQYPQGQRPPSTVVSAPSPVHQQPIYGPDTTVSTPSPVPHS